MFLPVTKHELFGRSARNSGIKVTNIEETAVFTVDFKIYSILILAFPGKFEVTKLTNQFHMLKICLSKIVTAILL